MLFSLEQVAAVIQQVMEMSQRMRQSEEVAEQARQLLEAHRNAGQMLEERLNRVEATATTDTSLIGGKRFCVFPFVFFGATETTE